MPAIFSNFSTTVGTIDDTYMPLTLMHAWSEVNRMIWVVLLALFGTILNGLFLTTFFIERTLNNICHIFLGLTAVSDLVVSCVILPVVAVVLSTDLRDDLNTCHTIQIIAETCVYAYNMFYALLAIENYYRLCRSAEAYEWFISMRIRFLCTSVYTLSISSAVVGVLLGLDYDYCERKKYGVYKYRLITSILFYVIPACLTFLALFGSLFGITRRINSSTFYRQSDQSEIDYSACGVNITAYILYIVCWTPYLKAIYSEPDIDDATFYTSAWVGICRSVFSALLYTFVKNFRRAFAKLLCYFLCKKSFATFSSRCERRIEYRVATDDVTVDEIAPTTPPTVPLVIGTHSYEVTQL